MLHVSNYNFCGYFLLQNLDKAIDNKAIKSSGGSGGGDGLVSVGEFGSKRAEQ